MARAACDAAHRCRSRRQSSLKREWRREHFKFEVFTFYLTPQHFTLSRRRCGHHLAVLRRKPELSSRASPTNHHGRPQRRPTLELPITRRRCARVTKSPRGAANQRWENNYRRGGRAPHAASRSRQKNNLPRADCCARTAAGRRAIESRRWAHAARASSQWYCSPQNHNGCRQQA